MSVSTPAFWPRLMSICAPGPVRAWSPTVRVSPVRARSHFPAWAVCWRRISAFPVTELIVARVLAGISGVDSQPMRKSAKRQMSVRMFRIVAGLREKGEGWQFQIELRSRAAYSENGMSKVRKLLHTRYRLNDLEKSVKFYKEVLGLEEVRRHKSARGSELVFMKAPESEETIELCHFPNSGPVEVQADLTHLAFSVDSLAEFGKHIERLGIKFSDGPHMKPEGGGIAFIDAPEGYEIELIEATQKSPGY